MATRRFVWGSVAGSAVLGATSAVLERPFADVGDGLWYAARGQAIPVAGPASEGRVVDARTQLEARLGQNAATSAGLGLARAAVVPLVAALGHGALRLQNELRVEADSAYENFITAVCRRDRGRGLLTVSNHCSVLDDPFLLGAIVPMPLALDARRQRWSVCSQEVCFSRGWFLSAFFGAGKTLPIKRGGGIDQAALGVLADQLARGDWVHIFPEGHVYQGVELGVGIGSHDNARDADACRRFGRLKRGAAKLIAHAPAPLVVVPFVHTGMDRLMPYNSQTGRCESKLWRRNQRVHVKFGMPLEFQDLIDDHERIHGKIERYGGGTWPQSTEADSVLYSRILARIEAVLLELQRRQRLEPNAPPPR